MTLSHQRHDRVNESVAWHWQRAEMFDSELETDQRSQDLTFYHSGRAGENFTPGSLDPVISGLC